MVTPRFFVSFFALIAATVAIKCYTGTTTGNDMPKTNAVCAVGAKYCMKTKTEGNGKSINNYSCGSSVCTSDGCTNPQKGVTVCCCDKDLCNFSSRSSSLFTIFPIIFAMLYLSEQFLL
ncbi:hypothetical protein KIN20_003192 [Parelaphostrongylus tenuis]|uniref:Uncharacterized protein n=1 Tax=Parelaphostrongylus tenuis TaxID=148309 RepID=A0AAD5MHX1_PARTN|nr:hypothetical protein KIN20_003192 [Parelaphostrongylus tenuis]